MFSTPFTATSLLNIGNVSISFPILVGIIFVSKFILESIKTQKIKKGYFNTWLLVFICCTLISLSSPLYIKNNFRITTNLGSKFLEYQELDKIFMMISHISYLIYCYLIYLVTIS